MGASVTDPGEVVSFQIKTLKYVQCYDAYVYAANRIQ